MSITDIQGKSPKMWVNEICVKQLVQPKWNTKEAVPGQSPPTFISQCTITYKDKVLEAEGHGKTKKEAEQEASAKMLFEKLGMTHATLAALANSAKAAKSSSSTSRAIDENDAGTCEEADELAVSDTDESDLVNSGNPIGDLLGLCTNNDLDEPEYKDVKMEGPSHKRIFTVRCTIKEINISEIGRRYQKKMAKKLAAFRALRQMKEQGYKNLTPIDNGNQSDSESASIAETDLSNSSGGTQSQNKKGMEDMNSLMETLRASGVPEGNEEKFLNLIGAKGYCNDTTERCLQFCINYSHAFQHLKQSEDFAALMNSTTLLDEDQDMVKQLENIAKELGVSLWYMDAGNNKNKDNVAFVSMKFPFNVATPIPTVHTLHGEGPSLQAAKNNAAKDALKFIRTMIS